MEFQLKNKKGIIRFNKGFKPKSLPKFLKAYSNIDEEELTAIFDKLNGSDNRPNKQTRQTKRSKPNKNGTSISRKGQKRDSKKE